MIFSATGLSLDSATHSLSSVMNEDIFSMSSSTRGRNSVSLFTQTKREQQQQQIIINNEKEREEKDKQTNTCVRDILNNNNNPPFDILDSLFSRKLFHSFTFSLSLSLSRFLLISLIQIHCFLSSIKTKKKTKRILNKVRMNT
jgi:hypothetical protein